MSEQSQWAIACPRCGGVLPSTGELAKHLVARHGEPRRDAARYAKAAGAAVERARTERIRRAAPKLLEACEQALKALLERTPGSVPGGEQACEALAVAIADARGES